MNGLRNCLTIRLVRDPRRALWARVGAWCLLAVVGIHLVWIRTAFAAADPDEAVPTVHPRDAVYQYGGIHVMDPDLHEALLALSDHSPTFRGWVEEVADSGFQVYIGSPEDFGLSSRDERVGSFHLPYGWKTLLPSFGGPVAHAAFLTVDLAGIRRIVERDLSNSERQPHQVDQIARLEGWVTLAHEMGHARSVALHGGRVRHLCDDPTPGQRPEEACITQKENLVRAEIGMPATTTATMEPASWTLAALGLP